jgi:hypothetical protein
MKSEAPSHDRGATRDESQRTTRFTVALFVIAELLCTGALIAWLVL